jgi:maleate isomerase
VILPDDSLNDDEYWLYLPPGVNVLLSRYTTFNAGEPVYRDTLKAAYEKFDMVAAAAANLRVPRVDSLVFSCNSCTFVGGAEVAPALDKQLQEVLNVPATTTTSAQVAALEALGVSRIVIGAPYVKELADVLGQVLEARGFQVRRLLSLGMLTEWEIGNADEGVWYGLAKDAARGTDAEAVVLACTGIRTGKIIDVLESDLNLPVVSAPAVGMWRGLRLAGIVDFVPDRGILFREY